MLSRSLVPQGSRTEKLLASTIMALGVGLRVAQYLNNRSLWGDEVAIALNLRLRTFTGLLHPLSYDQTMPLGLTLLPDQANHFSYGFPQRRRLLEKLVAKLNREGCQTSDGMMRLKPAPSSCAALVNFQP